MKKPAGKKRNVRLSKAAKPGSKAGTAASASGRASGAAKPDGKPPKPLEATALEPARVVSTLTASEQEELHRCENTIGKGWESFIEVGEALSKIRDAKLYRDTHERFEDYCREKLQYQKSQAYRLMDAARVVRLISPIGDFSGEDMPRPTCEAQVRPLVGLNDAQMITAWRQAAVVARTAEKPITARLVQKQVHEVNPSTKSPKRSKDILGLSRLPVTNGMKFQRALNELMRLIPGDDDEVSRRGFVLRRRLLQLVHIDPSDWDHRHRKSR